jgi:putative ABC transport system permease protein
VRRVEAEGGIAAVAVSERVPGAEPARQTVELEPMEAATSVDGGLAPAVSMTVTANRVARGFFEVFEVPLLTGRAFEAGDFGPGQTPVLINRTLAERIASEEGAPLGRRIRDRFARTDESRAWHEIVGIVADFPANDETPRLYLPMTPGQTQPLWLTFRVAAGTEELAQRLREIAASLDSALVTDQVQPLDARYRQYRMESVSAVSALAIVTSSVLLLSAAGMYALMSFTVNQRRREIGIRSALGAQPWQLLAGTFKTPLGQIATGAVVGLLAAHLVGRVILIEDLGGREVPGVLVFAALFMLVVGALAVAGPARRALRLAPTEALRDGG